MTKGFIPIVGFYLIVSFQSFSFGSVYYIDAVNGNDFNSGLSPVLAWKTISKVNAFVFIPGDQILFNRGGKWREQLNFPSSGLPLIPIIIDAYGSGEKPIISGADIVTDFQAHTTNVWKKVIPFPDQVFYNEIRGARQTSLAAINSDKKWFYDSTAQTLYIYSVGVPSSTYNSPGIEICARQNCIFLAQSFITIQNLQLEKTSGSTFEITSLAQNIIADNLTLYQSTPDVHWDFSFDGIFGIGSVDVYGANCEIRNSTIGKKTGDDIGDENWAGYIGIFVSAANAKIHHNNIYHSAIENESKWGSKAYGIRLKQVSGITEVYNNNIYHNGGHGILIYTNTREGDVIKVYNNIIEYPGMAGISAYQTRRDDGIGGNGYIYGNEISFANRNGGDIGGGGTQTCGIHLNNGKIKDLDPAKPYMKWYVYENKIHNSQSITRPNGLDSDGIGVDYNANDVDVFRNLVYNNWGKGIYLWNASRCKVYYNIIYGNDCGSTVTAASKTQEKAEFNEIYNNTYYKNYNTNAYGPNYNTEIYFGSNGSNNVLKNNIFYGDTAGVVYHFSDLNTTGCITDNNLVFKEGGNFAWDSYHPQQTFFEWRANHPQWDANSIYADPQFTNAGVHDFSVLSTSPVINKGIDLGFTADFFNHALNGTPDIGAVEFIPVPPAPNIILLNAMNGSFSGDARLGTMAGMKSSRAVYFKGTTGGVSINVNLPKTTTWYMWARMYYMSSGGKNSFFLNANGNQFILGDNDLRYDQWNWDGYQGSKINIGTLQAGANVIQISGREPGLTLWIDQIVLTDDPNFQSTDNNITAASPIVFLMNAPQGVYSGDARQGTMAGMKSTRSAYFVGTAGGVSLNVNIPNPGQWFAWARMYYMSSGGKNSFFITAKGVTQVLGDDSSKYNKWHWDGHLGAKINLGVLDTGKNVIMISGREPGLTLWVDQVIVTNDSTYNPNNTLGKNYVGEDNQNGAVLLREFSLSQNYPNPFNPSTKIRYQIPDNQGNTGKLINVSLKIYDILGNEVKTLVNEEKTPGIYEVNFNAGNLASGVYYYALKTENFHMVKSMVLLK